MIENIQYNSPSVSMDKLGIGHLEKCLLWATPSGPLCLQPSHSRKRRWLGPVENQYRLNTMQCSCCILAGCPQRSQNPGCTGQSFQLHKWTNMSPMLAIHILDCSTLHCRLQASRSANHLTCCSKQYSCTLGIELAWGQGASAPRMDASSHWPPRTKIES